MLGTCAYVDAWMFHGVFHSTPAHLESIRFPQGHPNPRRLKHLACAKD